MQTEAIVSPAFFSGQTIDLDLPILGRFLPCLPASQPPVNLNISVSDLDVPVVNLNKQIDNLLVPINDLNIQINDRNILIINRSVRLTIPAFRSTT